MDPQAAAVNPTVSRIAPGAVHDLPAGAVIAMALGPSPPGTAVPGLDELMDTTGLSRIEVVRGLDELEHRRSLERVPGSGRLVTRRVPYRVGPRLHASMTHEVERSGSIRPGMSWRSLVRSVRRLAPPAAVAHLLAVDPAQPALCVTRERLLDDAVVVHGTSWLSATLVPVVADELFDHNSMAAMLEGHLGGTLRRLDFGVDLLRPPPEIASILGTPDGEFAWWIESSNGLDGDRVVEYSQGWLRSDVFRVLLPEDPAAD